MDAEKVEEKTKSLVTEYMQVADLREAVLCVKEIVAGAKDADALGVMTKHMVAHVVDVSTEKARDLVSKLLAACVKQCGVDASVVKADLEAQIEQLEDIAIDVPMAPKLLGVMLAQLVVEGALEPKRARRRDAQNRRGRRARAATSRRRRSRSSSATGSSG